MRVFIALMPDIESTTVLEGLMRHRQGCHHTDDLHMTLRFLGDKTNTEVDDVIHLLESCDFIHSVQWIASYLGGFPDSLNANFWVVEGLVSSSLGVLLRPLKSNILAPPELTNNEFRPHVSLCNKKRGQKSDYFFEEGVEFKPLKLRFDRIVLMKSTDSEVRPRYQVLWQRNLT